MDHDPIDGTTPLDPDEVEDLIPDHIETRAELNEWEQANIAKAVAWLADRRTREHGLSLEFLRDLHRRMFDTTWRWAGQYRTTAKTIGIPAVHIPDSLKNLVEDTQSWIAHATYPIDEIGARFHQRLAWIHPFPNGNGRHARLMTDVLLQKLGGAPFTWGSANLNLIGTARADYISALRRADQGDYTPLIEFARR